MKKGIVLAYVVLGLAPTIFMFATHDLLCKYDMNPLCYIECILPSIIAAPILMVNGIDE